MSIMPETNRVRIAWRQERLPSSRYLTGVCMILIFVYFFEAVDNGAIGYFLPYFSKEFNLDKTSLGFLGTMSNVGIMLGAIVSGMLSDKFGRKKVICFTMFFWGLSGILQAYSWSLNSLIVARLLMGFGLGAQIPATTILLVEIIPSRLRSVYIPTLLALLPLGSAGAGLVSYFLIPEIGWRGVSIVMALPCLTSLLVFKFVPESALWLESKGYLEKADAVITKIEQATERSVGHVLPPIQVPTDDDGKLASKEKISPLREIFSRKYIRSTIMITLWYPAVMAAVYGLTTWFSVLFVERGFTISKSIGYVSIMYVGGVLGMPLVRYWSERYGRKPTTIIFAVAGATTAYFYGITTVLPLIILFGILYNVACYAAGMIHNLYAPELYSTAIRGTGLGYAQFVGRMGAVLGPIAIGIIMQNYGVQAVFYFAASLYLFYGIVVLILGTETKGKVFTE